MEARAISRYNRISPQKVRLVGSNVQGKPLEDAINILNYTPKKAARLIKKVLSSALANAQQNYSLDLDSLYVKQILVDEGPTLKRIKPRAMGRANRIFKRTSHVTVIVDEL